MLDARVDFEFLFCVRGLWGEEPEGGLRGEVEVNDQVVSATLASFGGESMVSGGDDVLYYRL